MKDTTIKVNKMLYDENINKVELCKDLGISRPTLNMRLDKENWKILEINWINHLFQKFY